MKTKRASYPLTSFKALKAADGSYTGEFEALVSVFGTVDLIGDKVIKGAFDTNLKEWRESGDPIPAIFSHQWDVLDAHFGFVDPTNAAETDAGLVVKGQADIDEPFALKLLKLMDQRRIKEWSFAYDIVDEQKGDDGSNELRELKLIEVGPTLKGMHPDTQLIGVKAFLDALPDQAATALAGALKDVGDPATPPAKAWVEVEGSLEQVQRNVRNAVHGWATGQFGDDAWAYPEATFEDRVVFSIQSDDGPARYFEAAYTMDDEGVVSLGEPAEVEITGTIEPKARRRDRKVGRVLSSKNETKLRDARDLIDGVLESLSDSNDDGKSGDNAEDRTKSGNAEDHLTPSRALFEADLADISLGV